MGAADQIIGGATSGAMAGTGVLPGWGTAAGAGLGAIGGFVAWLIQSGDEEAAQKLIAAAQDSAGKMTDESIQRALHDVLGPTKVAQIQQDPRFQSAQNDVLSELKRVSDSGGMTVEARGGFNDAIDRSQQNQSQLRQAALQRMRMRGQNASGAETQLLAAGAQGEANATAHAGVQALGDAQKRALEALSQRGQLAGSMQNADWQRKSEAARAQDEIDKLNWGNREQQYMNQAGAAQQRLGYATQQANNQRMQGQQNARMVENTAAGLGQAAVGAYAGMRSPAAPAQATAANNGTSAPVTTTGTTWDGQTWRDSEEP